ncbi:MAG: PilT/PilU family type 4a pilus ATPase [Desulfobacterium sp.]|nr:PilT/PilU family type 4a pilus ATPase [Desulfobacterium sp.]MBU3948288.1 PilT/PilU family type 4a pilus ATPase [Pseudomonadota bacterium]MBU4034956.1 PilT/PilU family type 4a pilus ATPase [Pseudomonadota bacterium]
MPVESKSSITSSSHPGRLGEELVSFKLITKEQLEKALVRRSQVEMPIGSLLIKMGFVSTEDMLDFLSKKFSVPYINLFNINIPHEIIKLIPLSQIRQYKILPISKENNKLTLGMVSPQDFVVISDLEFTMGVKIKPVVVPFLMMEAALNLLSINSVNGVKGETIKSIALEDKGEANASPKIESLLSYLVKTGATDMLLTVGVPPSIKVSNQVKRMAAASLTPADCELYAKELLINNDNGWEKFQQTNDLDIAATYPNVGRFRINLYRQRNSISINIRRLYDRLPTMSELNLPEWIRDYAMKPQGLIIISGPAGHGKSTTLCAMIDIINTNRQCNIVTLEDPVEYLHKHKKSNINQREIGRDTESFAKGLRAVFRQSPDVVVIGELRDKESFEIALKAAGTGSLVLCTMNAANSTAVIRIIVNMFEESKQNLISMLLADTLLLSLAQRLILSKDKTKQILVLERFSNSNRVGNLIREGKLHQIRSQMETGCEEFMSLDLSLAELYKEGQIDFEEGLTYSHNKQLYQDLSALKTK